MLLKGLLILVAIVVIIIAVAAYCLSQFNLSALPNPGATETSMANWTKAWLIGRAVRQSPPPPAPATRADASMAFSMECAQCHGQDGRMPTDIGGGMYPRASDLGSARVQRYSDAELFWIIKNGIRLSGMPAFGRVHSDTQIWNFVRYVRTLSPAKKN